MLNASVVNKLLNSTSGGYLFRWTEAFCELWREYPRPREHAGHLLNIWLLVMLPGAALAGALNCGVCFELGGYCDAFKSAITWKA